LLYQYTARVLDLYANPMIRFLSWLYLAVLTILVVDKAFDQQHLNENGNWLFAVGFSVVSATVIQLEIELKKRSRGGNGIR
jgi:hypothetical protein